MLVNLHHGNPAEHRRLLVAGVAFLTLIALLVAFSVAVYQKVFEPVTTVTIKAERAGLQLAQFGDVRLNGVLVGQVRDIAQDGEEASIEVGLRPEVAADIPRNVSVEILPTTLFGQKYISLLPPDRPADEPLHDGDVIPSDRVETNVELSRILADLFPLLRSIRPADLNATLNALATALGGRGEQIGETVDELADYLVTVEDQLPQLRRNLVLLADVADTYALAAPDLLRVLQNATVTADTLTERAEDLDRFLGDVAGVAEVGRRVLADNEENLVRAGEVTAPVMELLGVYSPEFPCLLRGLDRYTDNLNEIFEGDRVKQYIELSPRQYEPYRVEDRPEYGEVGHGPWCAGLPFPPVPAPPHQARDGNDYSIDRTSPFTQVFGARATPTMGYAGTPADQRVVGALLAAESGRSLDEYGAMPSLYYGPLVKGAEVSS